MFLLETEPIRWLLRSSWPCNNPSNGSWSLSPTEQAQTAHVRPLKSSQQERMTWASWLVESLEFGYVEKTRWHRASATAPTESMWDCKEDQETSSAKCRDTKTYMPLAAISHHSSGGMSYRILDGEPGGQDALPAGSGPRYKLKPGIEYQLGQLGTAEYCTYNCTRPSGAEPIMRPWLRSIPEITALTTCCIQGSYHRTGPPRADAFPCSGLMDKYQ